MLECKVIIGWIIIQIWAQLKNVSNSTLTCSFIEFRLLIVFFQIKRRHGILIFN